MRFLLNLVSRMNSVVAGEIDIAELEPSDLADT